MGSAWVQGFIGVISIFGKPVLGHQMRASERIYVGMSSLNGVLMSLGPTPQSKPSATWKEVPGPWHQLQLQECRDINDPSITFEGCPCNPHRLNPYILLGQQARPFEKRSYEEPNPSMRSRSFKFGLYMGTFQHPRPFGRFI